MAPGRAVGDMNLQNMKTIEKKNITTHSPEETHDLGKRLGSALEPGAVLFLTGELGSGKTAFVQGLARGLSVPETYYVTSPTYTIINEYPGRLALTIWISTESLTALKFLISALRK